MKDNLLHVWDKIKDVYLRLEMRQRVMIAILLALTFGIFIWMISWTTTKPKSGYSLLFARLSSEDAQIAINSLNDQKIPFRLKEEGRTTTIYVPEEVVHITRIGLTAGEFGMRSQAGVGFEIFDRTSLGQTERIQGINWVRANQGELERTIMAINGVDFARVHLVYPEERIFREDQREPSASVMLRLGIRLSKKQIDGIVNLIASAVEGLIPEEITIIDQDGKILNEPVEEMPLTLTDMQLKLQLDRERILTNRLQTMLDQALDVKNSIARVTVELNFDQIESSSEIFDPEAVAVRSEQIETDNHTSLTDSTSIISEKIISNYEVSSTRQTRINQVGDIKRLTAAVFVNYKTIRRIEDGKEIIEFIERTADDIAQIERVAQNAIGYNSNRGDQVIVASMLFDRSTNEYASRAQQEKDDRFKQYMGLAEKGAIIIVLVVLILVLISQFRKIFAQTVHEGEEELMEEIIETSVLPPVVLEGAGSEGFYPEGDEGMPMGEGKIAMTFKPIKDIELEQTEVMVFQDSIQKFVMENPEITVKLIKTWMMERDPLGRNQKK